MNWIVEDCTTNALILYTIKVDSPGLELPREACKTVKPSYKSMHLTVAFCSKMCASIYFLWRSENGVHALWWGAEHKLKVQTALPLTSPELGG